MVDYKINLAKSITSTAEQRRTFYNGMLFYLVFCAAGLVYVAYLTSGNVSQAYQDITHRRMLQRSLASSTGVGKEFFRSPEVAFENLSRYSSEIEMLKLALSERVALLPVMDSIISEVPSGVALQSMSGSSTKRIVTFVLTTPAKDGSSTSWVRRMQAVWLQNKDLMNRIEGNIKEVKRDRGSLGGQSVYYIQFECTLKQ